MNNFNISIKNNNVSININENLPEVNIIEMLSFDDDIIEELLKTHAAKQSYWEALAIRIRSKHGNFKNQWSKKWWAHNKKYARMVLINSGDTKPTVDSITDYTILIYSCDTLDIERQKFVKMAFDYYISNSSNPISIDDFYGEMYKYITMNPPWYFETVANTLQQLQEEYEIVQSVAEKLNSKSFHMQNVLDLVKAKRSNIGPESFSEREMINRMSTRR